MLERWGDPMPKRVALLRALPGLGDLLCAVPAMRALRRALPHAQISLIALPWAMDFVTRFRHYLDKFILFPGFPGLPDRWRSPQQTLTFLNEQQRHPFDLAIQMQGSGTISNLFTMLLGAKQTAGFFLEGEYCPDSTRFLPYPDGEPEVRRHLQLLNFLGIPSQGEELEFPIFSEDWQAFATISGISDLKPGRYVCIHPGASRCDRRWSPQAFAEVANVLASWGYQICLTGTAAEQSLTQKVGALMAALPFDLVGKTSLGALALLLKNSALLVCNDTGVSHLAAALQVKSVVIFSHSEIHRWAPLNRERHRIIPNHSLAKREVIAAAKALLEEQAVYVD
ncbi:MAG: glycosyltransferase family 9 protein [Chloroflexaceae bacterium]|nr:glycosyltransferase family 9 protein [Chloroflexaceae bacterium]